MKALRKACAGILHVDLVATAWTGVAAVTIRGLTCQRALLNKIPLNPAGKVGWNAKKGQFQQEYAKVYIFVIDEASFLASHHFQNMLEILRMAGHPVLIILLIDPRQLPPVRGSPLWTESLVKASTDKAVDAYNRNTDVFFLPAVMRCKADPSFGHFLERFSLGIFEQQDCTYINTAYDSDNHHHLDLNAQRIFSSLIIVKTRKAVARLNHEATERLFPADQIVSLVASYDPTPSPQELHALSKQTGYVEWHENPQNIASKDSLFHHRLDLAIGMPVLIIQNDQYATAFGFCNGAAGVVHGFLGSTAQNHPAVVLVEIKTYWKEGLSFVPEVPSVVPVVAKKQRRVSLTVTDAQKKEKRFYRISWPLVPFFAGTAYKVQSVTRNESNPVAIDIEGMTAKEMLFLAPPPSKPFD